MVTESMNRNVGMRIVFLGFFIAAGILTTRSLKAGNGPPTPAELLGAGIVYGVAGLIAEVSPGLGGAFAAAWTVGLALNMVNNPLATSRATPQTESGYTGITPDEAQRILNNQRR